MNKTSGIEQDIRKRTDERKQPRLWEMEFVLSQLTQLRAELDEAQRGPNSETSN